MAKAYFPLIHLIYIVADTFPSYVLKCKYGCSIGFFFRCSFGLMLEVINKSIQLLRQSWPQDDRKMNGFFYGAVPVSASFLCRQGTSFQIDCVCVCSDWTSKVFIIQTLPSLLPIWKTISYTFWYMENRVTIACTMDMCRFNLINIKTTNRVTIHLNFCTIAHTALRSLCMKRETFDYLN